MHTHAHTCAQVRTHTCTHTHARRCTYTHTGTHTLPHKGLDLSPARLPPSGRTTAPGRSAPLPTALFRTRARWRSCRALARLQRGAHARWVWQASWGRCAAGCHVHMPLFASVRAKGAHNRALAPINACKTG